MHLQKLRDLVFMKKESICYQYMSSRISVTIHRSNHRLGVSREESATKTSIDIEIYIILFIIYLYTPACLLLIFCVNHSYEVNKGVPKPRGHFYYVVFMYLR